MGEKADVWQGPLALMALKSLETMGPLHGYGIARRIEHTSGDLLSINYGILYPALLKLEQEGYIASEWGVSDNNRKAKYYELTCAGRKPLEKEAQDCAQTVQDFIWADDGAFLFRRICYSIRRHWPGDVSWTGKKGL